MNKILTRPKLKFEFQEDEEKYYSLKKPLIYEYEGKTYTIHPSDETGIFLFNLASVPWYLQWIHKPNSKQTLYPSIIHDNDYSNRSSKRSHDDTKFRKMTKSEQIFYSEKEPFLKRKSIRFRYLITRWAMYFALRLFGSSHKI